MCEYEYVVYKGVVVKSGPGCPLSAILICTRKVSAVAWEVCGRYVVCECVCKNMVLFVCRVWFCCSEKVSADVE